MPGTVGTPSLLRQLAGGGLVAHLPDLVAGVGPMNVMPEALHDLGELGVLGQESVARMDGVGAGDLGGRDEAGDVEVGLSRLGGGPMQTSSSAKAHVQGLAVRLAVDRDGLDAQLPAGADDPQGDLPAVGDQHLLEHQGV